MTRPTDAGPRTRLAWDRTALATTAFAALLFKIGLAQHRALDVATACCALVMAAVVWGLPRRPGARHVRVGLVALCLLATAGVTVVGLLA